MEVWCSVVCAMFVLVASKGEGTVCGRKGRHMLPWLDPCTGRALIPQSLSQAIVAQLCTSLGGLVGAWAGLLGQHEAADSGYILAFVAVRPLPHVLVCLVPPPSLASDYPVPAPGCHSFAPSSPPTPISSPPSQLFSLSPRFPPLFPPRHASRVSVQFMPR